MNPLFNSDRFGLDPLVRAAAPLLGFSVVIPATVLSFWMPASAGSESGLVDQGVPHFEWTACPYDLPTEVTDNRKAFCGNLVVPVRHYDPQGPILKLAVLILEARHVAQPAAPPLIYLHGGPGGSALASAYTFAGSSIRDDRDLILFDQRGAGYSGPALECPEVVDLWFDDSLYELSEEEQDEIYLDAHRACSQRYRDGGIDIGAYTTRESAADVDNLRRALGYEKVSLYGVSYGAELALEVMTHYPDGLHSVILDSAVPPTGGTDQTERAAVDALLARCEEDPDCRRAYPNLAAEYDEVLSALDRHPILLNVSDPQSGEIIAWEMDGYDVATMVGQSLRITSDIPLIPMVIHDVAEGRYAMFELTTQLLLDFFASASWGVNYAVNCGSMQASFTAGYPDPLEVEDAAAEDASDECTIWNPPEEATGNPVKLIPDTPSTPIPTLILAGQFDPLTTPDYAHWLADQLPLATAFTFPNAGHGVFLSSPCADNLMNDFLNDPGLETEPACLPELADIDFITDRDLVRLPILEFGLGIARRSVWAIGVLAFFSSAGLVLTVSLTMVWIDRLPALSLRKWWRTRRLMRRWEALHPQPQPRLTDRRLLIALTLFSIVFPCSLLVLPENVAFALFWLSPLAALLVFGLIARMHVKRSARRRALYRRWKGIYEQVDPHSASVPLTNTRRFVVLLILTIVLASVTIFWKLILEDYSFVFGLPRTAWPLWTAVALTILLGLLNVRDGFTALRMRRGSIPRRILQVSASSATALIVFTIAALVLRGVIR